LKPLRVSRVRSPHPCAVGRDTQLFCTEGRVAGTKCEIHDGVCPRAAAEVRVARLGGDAPHKMLDCARSEIKFDTRSRNIPGDIEWSREKVIVVVFGIIRLDGRRAISDPFVREHPPVEVL
jgi:hypothetical protein